MVVLRNKKELIKLMDKHVGIGASVEFFKKNLSYLKDRFEIWEGDIGDL